MNEKELVLRANDYIKQMANGINPLTGEVVPETDLINNIKISRCLFFVSQILEDYSDTIRVPKKPKNRFYATSKELANFNYSESPIYISVLTKKINDTICHEGMRKLQARIISDWLVSEGYLTTYTREDGKTAKKPTRLGEELGIRTIIKHGGQFDYTLNTYNINAQKFIIDHIEDISQSIQ